MNTIDFYLCKASVWPTLVVSHCRSIYASDALLRRCCLCCINK